MSARIDFGRDGGVDDEDGLESGGDLWGRASAKSAMY